MSSVTMLLEPKFVGWGAEVETTGASAKVKRREVMAALHGGS